MISDTHDLIYNEEFKTMCFKPNHKMVAKINDLHEYRETIEFQSSHIIYEKYKRKYNLDCKHFREMEMIAYDISKARKERGKVPNIDYLNQELSKFIKTKYEKNDNEQGN